MIVRFTHAESAPSLDTCAAMPPSTRSSRRRKSDGRWIASFVEVVDGQRKRRVIYAESSEEAHRKLRQALGRIDQGLPGLDSSDTFQTIAETWRRTVARTSGLSSKSQRTYADVLRLHVYPMIGAERMKDLKPSRISAVLVRMEDAGLSKSYQHQAHKAMSKVFQAAMADGLIASNPVRAVKAPRGGHKSKVVPSTRSGGGDDRRGPRCAPAGLRGGARLYRLPDLRGDGHRMVGRER